MGRAGDRPAMAKGLLPGPGLFNKSIGIGPGQVDIGRRHIGRAGAEHRKHGFGSLGVHQPGFRGHLVNRPGGHVLRRHVVVREGSVRAVVEIEEGQRVEVGNQIATRLSTPTADTRELLAQIEPLLRRIWRDDIRYMKGGVILADFTPMSMQQGDLFAAEQQSPRSEALMQVIDKINQGRLGKVYFAARGIDRSEWMMKREQLSPRYTTCISELPAVKA